MPVHPIQPVYRDAYLETFYLPGQTPWLLITFSPMSFRRRAGEDSFWGIRAARKAGLSAIGFVGLQNNWFPGAMMWKAIKAISPLLEAHPRRVLYGHSMGAYAAVAYSRALGADAVLACNPQSSIDPADATHFDRRYIRYFDPALRGGIAIQTVDLAGRVYLLYDPYHNADAEHVRRIGSLSGDVVPLRVPMSLHHSVNAITGTQRLVDVLLSALRADTAGLAKITADGWRTTPARPGLLARKCMARHPDWAECLITNRLENRPPREKALLLCNVARVWFGRRDEAGAERTLRRALSIDPKSGRTLSLLSEVHIRRREFASALEVSRAAVEIEPGASDVQLRFLRCLIYTGNIHEALDQARKALALDPSSAAAKKLLLHTQRLLKAG
jgi:tetratricopeptide (TPR) repeat protein